MLHCFFVWGVPSGCFRRRRATEAGPRQKRGELDTGDATATTIDVSAEGELPAVAVPAAHSDMEVESESEQERPHADANTAAAADSDSESEGSSHEVQREAEALPAAPPEPAPDPEQAPPNREAEVPWDVLFPKRNTYRDHIVKYVCPHLLLLLRDPDLRLTAPRDLVNTALEQCKANGNTFWGQWMVYTRKRSVADATLCHYFHILQDFVAGRMQPE